MKKISLILLMILPVFFWFSGCNLQKKTSCIKKYKDQPINKIEVFYLALSDSIECKDKLLMLNLLGDDKKKKEIKTSYEEFQDIEKLLGFVFHTWLDKQNKSVRLKTSDIIDLLDFDQLKKVLGKGYRVMDEKDKDFQIITVPDYFKIKPGDPFIKIKKYKTFFWIDSLLVKQANKPIYDFKKFYDLFRKSVYENNEKIFLSLLRQETVLSFGGIADHYFTNEQLIKQVKGFELKMLKKTVAQGYQVWQKKGQKSLCDEMILPIQPTEENAVFVKRGMEIWVKNCDGMGWEINSLYKP